MDVILIPGLWLDGSAWLEVAAELEALGHRAIPVTLPGQGAGAGTATLEDQIAAVVAAVDTATDAAGDPVLVVGHSAASSLAWIAADRRPTDVARVALVGGFPSASGEPYADIVEPTDGVVAFPGWDDFAGPDSADLDDAAKQAFTARAIPVPASVTKGIVSLGDDRRLAVPVTVVCPEYSPEQARAWIGSGDVPELAAAHDVSFVDIDSGHWPMFTRPTELARILDELTRR